MSCARRLHSQVCHTVIELPTGSRKTRVLLTLHSAPQILHTTSSTSSQVASSRDSPGTNGELYGRGDVSETAEHVPNVRRLSDAYHHMIGWSCVFVRDRAT